MFIYKGIIFFDNSLRREHTESVCVNINDMSYLAYYLINFHGRTFSWISLPYFCAEHAFSKGWKFQKYEAATHSH